MFLKMEHIGPQSNEGTGGQFLLDRAISIFFTLEETFSESWT